MTSSFHKIPPKNVLIVFLKATYIDFHGIGRIDGIKRGNGQREKGYCGIIAPIAAHNFFNIAVILMG